MYKQLVYHVLKSMGLGITRLRNPFEEIAALTSRHPVRTIVDGGAFRGDTVLKLSTVFPEACIHAFEPQLESFRLLESGVGHLSRVRLHNCALSDSNGEQAFFVNDMAYMSSLLPIEIEGLQTTTSRTVQVRTIDDVLAECGEDGADVMKLDLQGNELAALHGADKSLARCRALLLEVNFQPRYANGCSFEALAGFVGEYGFRMHHLYDIATAPNHGWVNADALFLRSDLSSAP